MSWWRLVDLNFSNEGVPSGVALLICLVLVEDHSIVHLCYTTSASFEAGESSSEVCEL